MSTCAPPDPAPKKPKFAMPAGACDAHCHVFGPAWKFPYAADRAYTPPDAPKETLAAMHRFLDVSRAQQRLGPCRVPWREGLRRMVAARYPDRTF